MEKPRRHTQGGCFFIWDENPDCRIYLSTKDTKNQARISAKIGVQKTPKLVVFWRHLEIVCIHFLLKLLGELVQKFGATFFAESEFGVATVYIS